MTELVPKQLLDQVVRRFDPIEVWLFGSRAVGAERPDSDVDLYVVVDDEGADDKVRYEAVAEATRGYHGDADVVVARRSVFERRRLEPGALARVVTREGRPVYRRG